MELDISRRLEEALVSSVHLLPGGRIDRDAPFNASRFFDRWFVSPGNSYFFLFKKNLQITNIQVAEFLALLKMHCREIGSSERADVRRPLSVQFVSAQEFKDFLQNLYDNFQPQERADIRRFANLYSGVLRHYIVVNGYNTSSTVYLPEHLNIDMPMICAESGYIHSCGKLVYIRNVTKVLFDGFRQDLNSYLARNPPEPSGTILFAVYCHEDFTEHDRAYQEDLIYGLDSVKIAQRKAMFGELTLVQALRKVQSDYQNVLEIPEPGDYRRARAAIEQRQGRPISRTMWMVSDSQIGGGRNPEDKKYYILYDQHYRNDGPYFVFDEDKPAWHSPTTLPHTLTAAMINIARPWIRDGQGYPYLFEDSPAREVRVIDPFSGSGTTYFEAKRLLGCTAVYADLDPTADLVFRDNLRFLRSSIAEVSDYLERLAALEHVKSAGSAALSHLSEGKAKEANSAYERVEQFWIERSLPGRDGDVALSNDDLKTLGEMPYFERLIFYVFCRAAIRNMAAFDRGSMNWLQGFCRELHTLCLRIKDYLTILERVRKDHGFSPRVQITPGHYSAHCFIGPNWADEPSLLLPEHMLGKTIEGLDQSLAKDHFFDLIVTDPPYGFNVEFDEYPLAKLSKDFVFQSVRSLKSGGQLVFCCPEVSYSGRKLPVYWRPGFITQLVHIAAASLGRRVLTPASSLPAEYADVRPPYYWEAPAALRRRILHFQID